MRIKGLYVLFILSLSSLASVGDTVYPTLDEQIQFRAQELGEIAAILKLSEYSRRNLHSFEGLGETSGDGVYYLQLQPIFRGDQSICLMVNTWTGKQGVEEISNECPKYPIGGEIIPVN